MLTAPPLIRLCQQPPPAERRAIWHGPWGALRLIGTRHEIIQTVFVDPSDPSDPVDRATGNEPAWCSQGRWRVALTGTAFQIRVWRALVRLQPGQRITYRGLAERIGRPRAVRAVASAVARNPVPVLIPCHRVVRSDGDLGGYLGGRERKCRILQWEQSQESA